MKGLTVTQTGYFDPTESFEAVLIEQQHRNTKVASLLEKLRNNEVKVQTKEIYSARPVSGNTVEFFASDDAKSDNLRNIDRKKLNEDEFLLLNRISIKAAHNATKAFTTDAATADAVQKVATWHEVDAADMGGLVNGFIEMSINNKIIFKDLTLHNFTGSKQGEAGSFYLLRPIFIPGGTEIDVKIKYTFTPPANKAMMIRLCGVGTYAN